MNQPAQPAISVCIANYNGERMLVDCIESILAQQCDEVVEIIVHDDASTDGSVALMQQRYPEVNLIVSDSNVGFCVSNNRLVDVAQGTYVLLLNNDAVLLPGALATLLAGAVEQNPHGILTLPQYDWASNALVDRGCLLDPFYNPEPNLDPLRRDVAYVIGACLWIPRTLWVELGGFTAWMVSIGEDIDLCCRARLLGRPVQALTQSGYRHRQGAQFGGNRPECGRLRSTYRRRGLSERNKTCAVLVLTPTLLLPLLLPLHALLLVAEGLVLSVARRDWRLAQEVYLQALLWPLRARALLCEARREIQQSRQVSWRVFYRPFTLRPRKMTLLLRYGLPAVD